MIVNVKGVGKAQFPDDMPIADIRSFLRNKYSQRAMQGKSDLLAPAPVTASPYEPTLTERLGGGIAEGLKSTGLITDNYGAQQIGKNVTALGEFLPGIGDATAGDEFGRAVAEGDNLGMGLAALGVVPVVGDAAKRGIKNARKLVDDIEFKYKSDIAPLQAEYRSGATPERQAEILRQSKELRQPLDAAKSSLFRLENAAAPKRETAQEAVKPNKTFKGKVFHQTGEQFDEFDLSKGADGTAWFTSDKKNFSDPSSSASAASGKSKILERDVDLKKVAGYEELDKYSIGELRQQGYDGAVLDGDIQVFDPEAIKQVNQSLPMDEARKITEYEGDYPLDDFDNWWGDRTYKEQGGSMFEMSPDEYLGQVKPLKMDDETLENIDDLVDHMQSGRKLDPLVIYADGKEDGRHRALAAKKLGLNTVPVIDYRSN